MAEKLELVCVTLCRHCRKAIGKLNYPIGWLHFSTHDGHKAEPLPFHWNAEGGGHTMDPTAYAT